MKLWMNHEYEVIMIVEHQVTMNHEHEVMNHGHQVMEEGVRCIFGRVEQQSFIRHVQVCYCLGVVAFEEGGQRSLPYDKHT